MAGLFWRNRDSVYRDSWEHFRQSQLNHDPPNLYRAVPAVSTRLSATRQ
ncbi:hypothetical protein [Synechococcus sp. MIT S1220]